MVPSARVYWPVRLVPSLIDHSIPPSYIALLGHSGSVVSGRDVAEGYLMGFSTNCIGSRTVSGRGCGRTLGEAGGSPSSGPY